MARGVGKDYRPYLVELVKASGRELINRAEQLVGDGELMTDFDILLTFDQSAYPLVRMTITREYACKEAEEYIFGGGQHG